MSEREKAVDTAIAQIERQFGKGSIMRLGQRETVQLDAGPGPTGGHLPDSLTQASYLAFGPFAQKMPGEMPLVFSHLAEL